MFFPFDPVGPLRAPSEFFASPAAIILDKAENLAFFLVSLSVFGRFEGFRPCPAVYPQKQHN
jgi:hypothetical protein